MNKNYTNIISTPGNQSGVTLIELMIALTIGAILLVGLATVFINSSASRRELEKSSALVENGRYAISMIAEDLSLAGFYGHFHDVGAAPATLPDPCILTAAGLLPAMAQPLQGYRAASLTTLPSINTTNTCGGLLPNANLTQGSDILIIRRADTAVLSAHLATSDGVPEDEEVYLLANRREAVILFGDDDAVINNTIVASDAADDAAQNTKGSASLGVKRSPSKAAVTTWADTRKYHVHVYFIAPCSRGSDDVSFGGATVGGICQTGDDAIPTLKRLSLGTDGSDTIMAIEPLVEGIEYMKLEYGIDTSPAAINATTGLIGDGIPDSYVTSPTTAQWASVVSVQAFLLARSPQATDGHNDTKSYVLGSTNIAATNDQFKRHVYSAEVRPTNIAGRREIPD